MNNWFSDSDTLFFSDETVVDVLDESSIISSGLSFEIIYKGSKLINFKYKPDIQGAWLMVASTNSESTTKVRHNVILLGP